MGDVLDSLFSVLPIVLGILWLLRRNARKKSKDTDKTGFAARSQKTDRQAGRPETSSPAARKADDEIHPGKTAGGRKMLESALARLTEFTETRPEASQTHSRGEEDLYTKLEGRRIEVDAAPVKPPNARTETKRFLKHREESGEKSGYRTEGGGPDALQRIAKLPPLAQGMIWSIILDEPAGVKAPPE